MAGFGVPTANTGLTTDFIDIHAVDKLKTHMLICPNMHRVPIFVIMFVFQGLYFSCFYNMFLAQKLSNFLLLWQKYERSVKGYILYGEIYIFLI